MSMIAKKSEDHIQNMLDAKRESLRKDKERLEKIEKNVKLLARKLGIKLI